MSKRELVEKDGKLDTKSLLEEGFLEEFAKEGGKISKPAGNSNPSVSSPKITSKPINANTEVLLTTAYEVRDDLISSFNDIQLGSDLSNTMKTAINKIGGIINGLGGEAEEFDPLSHISGLTSPNMDKYASRVIENTIDSYSFGKIEDAKLEGNSIIITFTGVSNNVPYKAIGTITTQGQWLGTEAIDYVYTPGEGKMSVKIANHSGEWVDHSDNYSVSWELFEGSDDETTNIPDKNIEKKAETKEEDKNLIENKLDNDISDDFPIEEK